MLFEVLFQAVEVFIGFVLDLLPVVPDMPQAIQDAAATIFAITANVGGIIVEIYGQDLFFALLVAGIAIIQFENVYHLILWVVRKIPISIH